MDKEILPTGKEIKALNIIHALLWQIKTGEMDSILDENKEYIYDQYKLVYDKFITMHKELSELSDGGLI